MDGVAITHTASDYAGLQAAAEAYIVALNEADVDVLREMFLPDSHLYSAHDPVRREQRPVVLPREAWLEGIASRETPSEAGFQPEGRVVMIDFLSEDTAIAKVECKVGAAAFTDYLNFLRVDGRWRVIAKIYHRHG